jgi:hypothetical protein
MYVISGSKIQKFIKLDDELLRIVKLDPGCIVILGGLTPKREIKLREIPELDAAFRSLPEKSRQTSAPENITISVGRNVSKLVPASLSPQSTVDDAIGVMRIDGK